MGIEVEIIEGVDKKDIINKVQTRLGQLNADGFKAEVKFSTCCVGNQIKYTVMLIILKSGIKVIPPKIQNPDLL